MLDIDEHRNTQPATAVCETSSIARLYLLVAVETHSTIIEVPGGTFPL